MEENQQANRFIHRPEIVTAGATYGRAPLAHSKTVKHGFSMHCLVDARWLLLFIHFRTASYIAPITPQANLDIWNGMWFLSSHEYKRTCVLRFSRLGPLRLCSVGIYLYDHDAVRALGCVNTRPWSQLSIWWHDLVFFDMSLIAIRNQAMFHGSSTTCHRFRILWNMGAEVLTLSETHHTPMPNLCSAIMHMKLSDDIYLNSLMVRMLEICSYWYPVWNQDRQVIKLNT